MASIQDWKNGKYRAHWRDDNNRPQSKVFARKRDAELWLDAVASDLHRGEYISPTLAATKFSVWADRWWATTGKHTSHTRRGYWKLLDGHVLPYFGDMPMNRIDYAEVERFISDKLGDGHSAKRVRDMVSIVSLIMKLAMKSKARRDNPAKEHTIPHRKRKIRQGDVPDMADVHRLVAATRDPYKPAVWLLALLGLRPAELCGLRVGAVDFGRRTVHIRETLNAVHSFPGHSYGLEVGDPKSDAGDRVISIPAWLADELAAVLAERAERTGRAPSHDDFVFLSIKERGPIRPADLRRWVIRPALEAAGLPTSIRTYDLRHSHASMLIDQGANPLEVAQRMGHTDANVTLRVYGHLFNGAQERLTDLLDKHRADTAPTAPVVVNLDDRRRSSR